MAVLVEIVEGWTETLDTFTCLRNKTAFSLTGYTVAVTIRDSDGNVITPGGTVTVLNQTTYPGQLTYAPHASDFSRSTALGRAREVFEFRVKVTDSNGKIAYFPNGDADEISVYRA